MKEKIDIAIKTVETSMESLANTLDYLKGIQKDIDNMEIMPKGIWEDINEFTAEKRCSNCGVSQVPHLNCHNCRSRNRQKTQKMV